MKIINTLQTSGTEINISENNTYTLKENQVCVNNQIFRKEDLEVCFYEIGNDVKDEVIKVGIRLRKGNLTQPADFSLREQWSVDNEVKLSASELIESLQEAINFNNGGGNGNGVVDCSLPFIFEVTNEIFLGKGTQDIEVKGFNFSKDTVFGITESVVDLISVNIIDPYNAIITVDPKQEGFFSVKADNCGVTNWNEPIIIQVKEVSEIIPNESGVIWENVIGNLTATTGELKTSDRSTGWNKQAQFGVVPVNTDFELTFKYGGKSIQNTDVPSGMFGLSKTLNTVTDFRSPNYLWYMYQSGISRIYESGQSITVANVTNPVVGDTYSIKRNGDTITYYLNGDLKYTSLNKYTGELYFDCSLYRNIRIYDIKIIL